MPVIKSGIISFHATLAALAVFASYSYRDIWPLLTFTLDPADGHEGLLLWAKIVVAAIAGIFIPMFEPYVYVPLDPSVSVQLVYMTERAYSDLGHPEHPKVAQLRANRVTSSIIDVLVHERGYVRVSEGGPPVIEYARTPAGH